MRTVLKRMSVLLLIFVELSRVLHAGERRADSCNNYAREIPPKFRLAREIPNQAKQALILFVSVDPRDIAQDKLLSLTCSLGITYAKNQTLVVWILDNYHAAKYYNPQGEGNDRATNLAFRASYGFSRGDNSQSLRWLPDPHDDASAVDIELGPPPPLPSP